MFANQEPTYRAHRFTYWFADVFRIQIQFFKKYIFYGDYDLYDDMCINLLGEIGNGFA
jgi:hypothetical protein